MAKALFLDRDGVLNEIVERNGQVTSPRAWEEVVVNEDLKSVAQFKEQGFRLIMVTNQPEIARGLVKREFVEELNTRLASDFGIESIQMCDSSDNADRRRKPNPGMLLDAAEEFQIDLSESFFLGDTIKDVKAARSAGCRSVVLDRPYNEGLESDHRVHNFGELRELLLTERSEGAETVAKRMAD